MLAITPISIKIKAPPIAPPSPPKPAPAKAPKALAIPVIIPEQIHSTK